MSRELGEAFARELASKDAATLRSLLRPDVSFRAMTPEDFWEANDADTVVNDILLGQWFEPTDNISEILAVETAIIGRRYRVGYRFSVENQDGKSVVEQQAYYEPDEGQIGWLRMMCVGFMPT